MAQPRKTGGDEGEAGCVGATCPLFDTPSLVGHLEDLYRQMWSDFKRGALPVPDLRNLDIYHEIGVGLDLENIEALSDDGLCRASFGPSALALT